MPWRNALLAIIAALLLLIFLRLVPAPAEWLSHVLRTLPAPTETWASIIGSLAWPGMIAYLVIRYRSHLGAFLDTIARRLQTDRVKVGPFELTPNSAVIALDPAKAAESTDDYAPVDIDRIQRLFEFISEKANLHKLALWVNENVGEELDIVDFVTAPKYATQREQAYQALVERKE